MRIFLSWSGNSSLLVARELRDWLPLVVQAVKPWMSDADIDKGARWFQEIGKELEAAQFGIICVTRENLTSPWLLFEAGALSKQLGQSKVVPLLIGLRPSDVTGPLAQFQACVTTLDDAKKLMSSINRTLGDGGIANPVLERSIATWYPQLEKVMRDASSISNAQVDKAPSRSDREVMEEILGHVRDLNVKKPQARGHSIDLNDVLRQYAISTPVNVNAISDRIDVSNDESAANILQRYRSLMESLNKEREMNKMDERLRKLIAESVRETKMPNKDDDKDPQ